MQLTTLGSNIDIIGGKDCQKVNVTPQHGNIFSIGSIAVKALHTPCHTQDSICYFMQDGDEKVVFTGDTLFHGGESFSSYSDIVGEMLNCGQAAADSSKAPARRCTRR